jgi:hypothetical protein
MAQWRSPYLRANLTDTGEYPRTGMVARAIPVGATKYSTPVAQSR